MVSRNLRRGPIISLAQHIKDIAHLSSLSVLDSKKVLIYCWVDREFPCCRLTERRFKHAFSCRITEHLKPITICLSRKIQRRRKKRKTEWWLPLTDEPCSKSNRNLIKQPVNEINFGCFRTSQGEEILHLLFT